MIEPERLLYLRWLAARFLLYQKRLSPVIDVRELELPRHIYFSSFDNYARTTGISPAALLGGGLLTDGFTIRQSDCCIILYNASHEITCPQRLRFSLAHELGHVFLHHRDDSPEHEAEANYFASQTVAHDAVVLPLLQGNWNQDMERIRERFGLSWEAADIKLRSMNRNPAAYTADEQQLCRKYYADCSTGAYTGQKFAAAYSAAYVAYEEAP